jgi:uncharacterized protein (TIGR03437 family)
MERRNSHSGKKVIKTMGRPITTKRITLFSSLVVFTLTAFAQQPTIVSTRIVTVPNGIQVAVDGQTYKTPITLLWPQGSSHTLHGFDQQPPGLNTRFQFSNWTSNRGVIAPSNAMDPSTVVVTADPSITEIDANYATAYQVQVSYFNCPGYSDPMNPCPANLSPGTVIVGGVTLTQSASIYTAGMVSLQATPNPGWTFAGWYSGTGTDGQAFLGSVNVTGPMSIYPHFVLGKAMTIQSSPPGLTVLADRSPVLTPVTLTWGIGTTHQLGSAPDQIDSMGKLWVFSSWSDGGTINHAYVEPNTIGAVTVTAIYVPGQRVSFLTNPPGLSLTIDGRSNWLSNNFNWTVNSQHTVAAPPTQTDANGNQYTFTSWSQGGPASQTITTTQDPGGLNLQFTANYSGTTTSKFSVVSQTSGLAIQVDGQDCAVPCTFSRLTGTPVHLTTPASTPLTSDSRLDFVGWNDSSSPDRMLTTPGGPVTLTLSYMLRNHLTATVTPSEGASVVTTPAAADGYFDAQAQVQVTAQTKLGFTFQNWSGDISSSSPTINLSMSSPKSLQAALKRVPALLDGAVKNAAGDTPLNAVAAGSIISIEGVNLASNFLLGPRNPLTQTLESVTVRVGAKILPLVFVAPKQINAQLPPDLVEGAYTLTVQSDGNPDVSADFTVARNAPGLYNKVVNGQAFGLFLHENGDPITADSPAHRDETVTLLGTGFGPLLQMAPEGFPVPESDTSVLADPLSIVAGDNTITPAYAGAADGRVGVMAIRFPISDPLPTATRLPIKVNVGSQDSNTVLLPLE